LLQCETEIKRIFLQTLRKDSPPRGGIFFEHKLAQVRVRRLFSGFLTHYSKRVHHLIHFAAYVNVASSCRIEDKIPRTPMSEKMQ